MKQKYQKIIIPTLSLFLTSCGGGSNGDTSQPTHHYGSSENNHASISKMDQAEHTDVGTTPNPDTALNLEATPDSEVEIALESLPNVNVEAKPPLNVAKEQNLSLLTPLTSSNIQNDEIGYANNQKTPDFKGQSVTSTEIQDNKSQSLAKNGGISSSTSNHENKQYLPTHDINSSGTLSLTGPTQYIDDENLVKDIGIIDTSYYLSDSFKDNNGKQRVKTHNQAPEFDEITNSHGTSVVAVINKYNKTATMYAYNAYQGSKYPFVVKEELYDTAHAQGVRIFNNSYGSDAINEPITATPRGNIAKYAKEDSIFVWAAGNENQNHGTPQSLYPMDDDNVRNGWISVAEVDYSKGIKETNQRKLYNNSASNYIGETAKTWGIAAQGEYFFSLKNKNHTGRLLNNIPTRGTSFATPRVTAAAANVWTKFPWMDHHLVIVSLLSSADKPATFLKDQDGGCQHEGIKECGEPTTGPEYKFGWGLLNERRALKGPARFDKRLLTNKDAKLLSDDKFEKNINISGQNSSKDLLVVNFDFRNYKDKEKLTWSNNIKGDAGILKQGNGTLYLNGQNEYQGKTIVDGGMLGIGHSLTSDVIINQGGTLLAEFDTKKYNNQHHKVILGKNDNTQNYTVKNNGSLNVYGAGLKINGNYQGAANSRIVIDIEKSNLEVTGTMDMGNTSKIVADVKDIAALNSNGIPSQNETEKTIITAKSISNHQNITYAKSDRINSYIDISKFYIQESKEIKVVYKRNSTAYVLKSINYTPKSALQTASNVDSVLDTLATSDRTHQFSPKAASLLTVDNARLPTIINSLSGEIYASSQSIIINQNLLANQMLSQRIMSVSNGSKNGLWIDGIYANSKINQNGYASANVKSTGSQIGIDNKISDQLTLGFALTQSNASAKFNQETGENKTKNIGTFVYGAYHFDNLYIATIAGLNHATSNVNRTVFDEHTSTKFNSKIYNTYAELGTNIRTNRVQINPFIAHAFNHIHRGRFKENVAFGIDANSKNYNINTVVLGARSEMRFNKLTLNASLSHAYTPQKNNFGFDAKFTGFDNTIYISGAEQSQHMSWFGLGASYELVDGLSLQITYNLSARGDKKDNEVMKLGAIYRF